MAPARLSLGVTVLVLLLPALSNGQFWSWFTGSKETTASPTTQRVTPGTSSVHSTAVQHHSPDASPTTLHHIPDALPSAESTSAPAVHQPPEEDNLPETTPSHLEAASVPSSEKPTPFTEQSPTASSSAILIPSTVILTTEGKNDSTETAGVTRPLQTTESPTTSRRQEEKQIWNIFSVQKGKENVAPGTLATTPVAKDETSAPSVSEVPISQKPQSEQNIAGVGAEILNVAEGIRNFVHGWEDNIANSTKQTPTPDTEMVTATTAPSLTVNDTGTLSYNKTEPSENTMANHTEGPVSEPHKLISSHNKPLLPGISSFPADSVVAAPLSESGVSTENVEAVSPSSLVGLEGAALIPGTADAQTLLTDHTGSMRISIPQVTSLSSGLSHDVLNSSQLNGNNIGKQSTYTTNQVYKSPELLKHSGIAATLHGVSAPNNYVTSLTGHPHPSETDLLTSTKSPIPSFSHNSSRTAFILPRLTPSNSRCLPTPTSLSFCKRLGIDSFLLPNYLNHSTVLEIQAALHDWEGLFKSQCHRYLESFFCLLLAPSCNAGTVAPPLVPCRQFCEVLQDACWNLLEGSHLPVSCDSLPGKNSGVSCLYIHFYAGPKTQVSASSELTGKY